jgi:hypothetical protein
MNYQVKTKAFIYQREIEFISRCVLDYPNIETGGDLFGFWTHTGCPVIQYVIGPGKRANHQAAFFNQELEYLSEYGNVLRTTHGLQHIGQWHSHHQLGLAEPSHHDINTVCNAINQYRLGQFFLIIANIRSQSSTINGFLFRNTQNRQFDYAGWQVMEGESPIRREIDCVFPDLPYKPATVSPAINSLTLPLTEQPATYALNFNDNDWLSEKANHLVLKQILDLLVPDFGHIEVFMSEPEKSLFLQLKGQGGLYRFILGNEYPRRRPVTNYCHKGIYREVCNGLPVWAEYLEVAERTVSYIKEIVTLKIRKKHLSI